MKDDKCLDLDLIAQYVFGDISKEDRKSLHEHISFCDKCLDKFIFFQKSLEIKIPFKVKKEKNVYLKQIYEQIKQQFEGIYSWNNLIMPPVWSLSQAQPVPVYSDYNNKHISFRSENEKHDCDAMIINKKINNFRILLFASKIDNQSFTAKIRVLKDNEPHNGLNIILKNENGSLETKYLNLNYVKFDSIAFGKYSLILNQDGDEILRLDFNICNENLSIIE